MPTTFERGLSRTAATALLELLGQFSAADDGDRPDPGETAPADDRGARWSRARLPRIPVPHVHHYRYSGEDAFSSASLYRCRCGVVKPGL